MIKKIMLLLFTVIFFNSCEEDEGPTLEDVQDSVGNLVILNYTTEKLVLYDGDTPLKIISTSAEDYLVNVSTPGGVQKDLRIYRYDDVSADLDNPDYNLVLKRWLVVLYDDTEAEHRATWRVTSSEFERASGTITFNYLGGTSNNVDVYLDDTTSTKIISLGSGHTGKQVGVDYKLWSVYYQYWYSDQNTNTGRVDIGWYEYGIWVNLNDQNNLAYLQVPHKDVIIDDFSGDITIKNEISSPIIINVSSMDVDPIVNHSLIENEMIYDGPTLNMSTILPNVAQVYNLKEGEWTFFAQRVNQGSDFTDSTMTIDMTYPKTWIVTE